MTDVPKIDDIEIIVDEAIYWWDEQVGKHAISIPYDRDGVLTMRTKLMIFNQAHIEDPQFGDESKPQEMGLYQAINVGNFIMSEYPEMLIIIELLNTHIFDVDHISPHYLFIDRHPYYRTIDRDIHFAEGLRYFKIHHGYCNDDGNLYRQLIPILGKTEAVDPEIRELLFDLMQRRKSEASNPCYGQYRLFDSGGYIKTFAEMVAHIHQMHWTA